MHKLIIFKNKSLNVFVTFFLNFDIMYWRSQKLSFKSILIICNDWYITIIKKKHIYAFTWKWLKSQKNIVINWCKTRIKHMLIINKIWSFSKIWINWFVVILWHSLKYICVVKSNAIFLFYVDCTRNIYVLFVIFKKIVSIYCSRFFEKNKITWCF